MTLMHSVMSGSASWYIWSMFSMASGVVMYTERTAIVRSCTSRVSRCPAATDAGYGSFFTISTVLRMVAVLPTVVRKNTTRSTLTMTAVTRESSVDCVIWYRVSSDDGSAMMLLLADDRKSI